MQNQLLLPSAHVVMFIAILFGELFKVFYDNYVPVELSYISLLYVFGYLYVIMLSREQYSLKTTVLLFLIVKVYILSVMFFNGSIEQFSPAGGSDWERFHVPQALEMNSYFEHLFSVHGTYNGRLTHVIIAIYVQVLEILGADPQRFGNIMVISNLGNMLICMVTLFIIYKAAMRYSSSEAFSRRAVWFLAFNPFFILSTSTPRKETLLFFALSMFLLFLVSKSNARYLLLALTIVIITFERVYLLPLIAVILFFVEKKIINKMFLPIVGIIVFQFFLGIDRAASMLATHIVSLTSIDGSFMPGHGVVSNVFRTMFGPAFFRPLLEDSSPRSILSFSKYFLYLFFGYVSIKSLFNTRGVLKVMLLSYLFVLIFVPFHGTLKMLLVVIFGTIFLDVISFVKFREEKIVDSWFQRCLKVQCGNVVKI